MYPGAQSPNPVVAAGAQENQTSPPFYPSPWTEGAGDWADAYAKAKDFVSKLTLLEKVNLTTGVGSVYSGFSICPMLTAELDGRVNAV